MRLLQAIVLTLFVALSVPVPAESAAPTAYSDLVELFHDWRAFESAPRHQGAPDYRAETMARQLEGLAPLRARLNRIDITEWPVAYQVDWHLVRAEMNGLEFNIRVLRPWQRDPAFYASVWTFQSDTPAHEGPTHHDLVELWTYDFPLDDAAAKRLASEIRGIRPLLRQARGNLTGNARELWIGGIKNIEDQVRDLTELAAQVDARHPALASAVQEAIDETEAFARWLREEGEHKTGPSGIGADFYTWHLRNVHLVPLSWEDERFLLKRELDRAHSSLRLEEHHNRDLPPQVPISSEDAYAVRAEQAVKDFLRFLKEEHVLPPYDYLEGALRAHMGQFIPAERRNFFYTVSHHDPLALWTHWYHWFDLARIAAQPHPSPIRRGPLLYNIWDSRAEGMATGFEEMAMHAGLFDDSPRSRELVYVMLAQRAARGLGSLRVHAGSATLKEARDFHVAWTPRGWMREDLDLLGFEQLLYLRQPGYGTSYVTGKYLIERLLAEWSAQREGPTELRDFFGELDTIGVIPVSLIRWQMTGKDDEIRKLMSPGWTAWPQQDP
ncbi:MAG: hypothetical protein R3348_03065 [Xanthomonadales bacterium]|nr:hypothetical protein [Xanthomonadales bacterium]